ncbi:hypothetical protein ACX80V_07930 [Arthrobacter sp. MDT3-24]
MSTTDVSIARSFVESLDLSGVPTHGKKFLEGAPPPFMALTDEDQALVIGSQVQSFVKGVDAEKRRVVKNAMLLAQLAAEGEDDVQDWYATYFSTLGAVGLLVEQKSAVLQEDVAIQADVEKAVLKVAVGLLTGPALAGYQVLVAALEALQQLDEGSPAVTIFRRQTHSETAKFQVAVALDNADGELEIFLLAFRFTVSSKLTQTLVFKFKTEEAHLSHQKAVLGVVDETLDNLAPQISEKVAKYTQGYIRQIKLPQLTV